MDNAKVLKIISVILAVLGLVTTGVCIWIIADPVNVAGLEVFDGGNSTKIGLAAAILMVIVGIAAVIIPMNSKERIFFSSGLTFMALALSLVAFSIAINDNSNLSKLKYISDTFKTISTRLELVAGLSGSSAATTIFALIGFFMNRA